MARLWHQRLHKGSEFRILYIPEWHKIDDDSLRDELLLCFHDDPDMRHRVVQLTRPQDVRRLLIGYTKQRLVIILDQAFDRVSTAARKQLGDYFPLASQSIRIVFASSPRFELQGNYLAGDPKEVIPFPFMNTLHARECASMAIKLLYNTTEARLPNPKLPEAELRTIVQGMACLLFVFILRETATRANICHKALVQDLEAVHGHLCEQIQASSLSGVAVVDGATADNGDPPVVAAPTQHDSKVLRGKATLKQLLDESGIAFCPFWQSVRLTFYYVVFFVYITRQVVFRCT